ncbi:MAG: PKD domain-containing protein [bacterium]|nr:PKD domain-containing protein [bacterium]
MTRFKNTKLTAGWALPVLMLSLLMACSTDSPTAPQQQPTTGGGGPSANWVLKVTVSPDLLRVNDQNPATVTVDVRRADNNLAPPSGTTIVVSTSLGEFDAPGSALTSLALGTVNGRAQVPLFPGAVTGVAVITAQLEASAGQTTIEVLEELPALVAAFSFQNTTDNLSIQFLNESSGRPDRFLWDFGDGNTSTEEHPAHIYALPGDYPVELTIFRGEEFAKSAEIVRAVQDVFITDVNPRQVRPGERLQIRGQGFDNAIRVLVNGLLSKLISKSSTLLVIDAPVNFAFPEEPCDSNGDGILDGFKLVPIPSPISITVEVSGNVGSDTVAVDLTILTPLGSGCVPTPGESGNLFITDISPNAGPASGGQSIAITGTGFSDSLRVFIGGGFATTLSVTPTRVVVVTPPGILATVPCNIDADPETGLVVADTLVDVVVELASGTSHTAPGGYTYLAPIGAPCNGD